MSDLGTRPQGLVSRRDIPFLGYTAAVLAMRLLPLSLRIATCGRTADMLGAFWYAFDRKSAGLARRNIRAVFGDRMSEIEIEATAKSSFQVVALGKLLDDLLPVLSLEQLERFLVLEGRERLEAALEGGRGVILLGVHFGLHGYIPMALMKRHGYPFATVATQEAKTTESWAYHSIVHPVRGRNWDEYPMINVTDGTPQREIVDCLRRNEALMILGDFLDEGGPNLPPPHILPAQLMGHPLMLKTGAFRLSHWMKIPILPFFVIPDGERYRMLIEAPLELSSNGSSSALALDLENFMDRFQPHFASNPALWWLWRRDDLLLHFQPTAEGYTLDP